MNIKMNKNDGRRDPRAPTPPMTMTPLSRLANPGGEDGAAGSVEHRAGRLLASVASPAPLDRAALAAVRARLFDAGAPGRPRARIAIAFGRFALGSTFGGVALLASSAVIAMTGIGVVWKVTHEDVRPAANVTAAAPAAPTRARSAGPARKVAAAEVGTASTTVAPPAMPVFGGPGAAQPSDETRPAPAAPAPAAAPPLEAPAPAPRPAQAHTASPASGTWRAPLPAPRVRSAAPPLTARSSEAGAAAGPAPGALAQETRLLGQALRHLRQRRDGASALALLDEYAGRFPGGTLAAEATRARIDALLLLERRDEALRSLDAASLEPLGRSQELLVIRGELRGRTDCATAIADFDLALSRSAPSSLVERALYGRAICAARLGRDDAARTDARAYLARYPSGRFAAGARRLAHDDGPRPSTD